MCAGVTERLQHTSPAQQNEFMCRTGARSGTSLARCGAPCRLLMLNTGLDYVSFLLFSLLPGRSWLLLLDLLSEAAGGLSPELELGVRNSSKYSRSCCSTPGLTFSKYPDFGTSSRS